MLLLLTSLPALAQPRWQAELVGFTEAGRKQIGVSWGGADPLSPVEGKGWLDLCEFARSPRIFEASLKFLTGRGDCEVYDRAEGMGTSVSYYGRWLEGWTALGPALQANLTTLPNDFVMVDFELESAFLEGEELAFGRFRTSMRVKSGDSISFECLDQQRNSIPRGRFPRTVLYLRVENEVNE